MNEKQIIPITQQVYSALANQDFEYLCNDLDSIIRVFQNVYQYYSDGVFSVDSPENENVVGLLMSQYSMKTKVLTQINHSLIWNHEYHYDLNSSYIISRSLLENYLTFVYLYIGPKDTDEETFRYNVYKYHGLCKYLHYLLEREKLGHTDVANAIVNQRLVIEETKLNFIKNPYYEILKGKRKDDIIKGNVSRVLPWVGIINEAEIDRLLIKEMWQMFTSYSHNEYYSLNNLGSIYKDERQLKDCRFLILHIQLIVLSNYIMTFYSKFGRKYDLMDTHYLTLDESVRIKILAYYNISIARSELGYKN